MINPKSCFYQFSFTEIALKKRWFSNLQFVSVFQQNIKKWIVYIVYALASIADAGTLR